MEAEKPREKGYKSWLIIALLVLLVFAKGLFAFFRVGDLGPPGWDFRPVPDVPGESAYAMYPKLPDSQHIRGLKGE